jgi:outer membrane lipase/esterase
MFDIQMMKFFLIICINYVQTKNLWNTIVAFGDANTDTGNVYNLTNYQWPLVPPYYQGRFSNGPLWIECLNNTSVFNYAYADATIDSDNLIAGYTGPNLTIVPSIRQQIITYLSTQYVGSMDTSQIIYIIWAGADEYIINPNVSASAVVAALLSAVYDLLGNQIKNLIVVNLPPLQSFPGLNSHRNLSTVVNQHNDYLLTNISYIQSNTPGVSIRIFDLYSLIAEILSNNSVYKLNKTSQCWTLSNYKIISQCSDPDQYVFIDNNYHFTRVIHQIIGDNIQQLFVSSSLRIVFSSKFSLFLCVILSRLMIMISFG